MSGLVMDNLTQLYSDKMTLYRAQSERGYRNRRREVRNETVGYHFQIWVGGVIWLVRVNLFCLSHQVLLHTMQN